MAMEVSNRDTVEAGKRTDVGYKPVPVPRDNHEAVDTLPRVCTARVPLLNTVPTEVHLNLHRRQAPVSSSLPQKHQNVQTFAHGNILDIGAEIHRLTVTAADRKTEEAVRQAEERVWGHAESIRIKALQDLQARLVSEHQETLKRLHKDHDKALKEAGLKVETTMRQLSLEQVKHEREEADKRQKVALKQLEDKLRAEMAQKVDAAAAEERKAAQTRLDELDRDWKQKHDGVVATLNQEKQRELLLLSEKKDWDKQQAILQTKQSERAQADKERSNIIDSYEGRIKVVKHQLGERDAEIRKANENHSQTRYRLQEVGEELFQTRDTFRDYIHQVCQCTTGQADYQMPNSNFKRTEFLPDT